MDVPGAFAPLAEQTRHVLCEAGAHDGSNGLRSITDLVAGEAAQTVPVRVQLEFSGTVVLERLSAAVSRVAVGLDDEALLAPEEVDGEAADAHVHFGRRELVTVADAEKAALELTAGVVRWHVSEIEPEELGLARGAANDGSRGDPG